LLDDAFKLIESLRAELFKSRAETQKALGEKEKAESECIHAKLKLDQMQARLDSAQDALHAGAQDRRVREVQGAFDQADQEYRVRMAKAAITTRLLSRSPGKNALTG
jgi:predicted  nucleic acid-binding Zn-ribbon protein